MSSRKSFELPWVTQFKKLNPIDKIGVAAFLIGIGMVALGWTLEELDRVEGVVGPLRNIGGVLLLGGIAALLLGEPRRRKVVINSIRRLFDWYMKKTARWIWPNRVGLAGVAIGMISIVPTIILQIIFRTSFGLVFLDLISFWVGIGLLVYGIICRLRHRGSRKRHSSPLTQRDTEYS